MLILLHAGCPPCTAQMESWARQGAFPGVAFVCVSTDMNVRMASFAAKSFANKLQMTAAINSFSLRRPEAGQLGCSGFVVLRPQDAEILIRATPSFLQHGPRAHR
ncbi:hypothetical protein DUNSADRAFT_13669 [Dunaliella salina]|uniref:Alkyl hydroperoxide reductase subunit C/ Thiol specific antioxidant domain-containing protein n=1 Tax=Dunaliella salina TaxID=3046 RepID=A0ABQ7FTE9_DUNSA|nr:hypothetical protein DUNSADRAFT_13669 [Dunaliella salina]|eukprot:KAF5825207.1 hypothetical protein DUNSADRAFT_13669 [Dunaliella salina]